MNMKSTMNITMKYIAASITAFVCALIFAQIGFAAEPEYLVEYPISGKPFNIAVQAPDMVWFTMPDDNAIGFLDTTDANNPQYTQYDLPNANSEPYDIVYDSGFVWFTEKGGSRIGKIDVSNGQLNEYDIPTTNSGPTGIDVAPNGVVWFLEHDANKLAQYDPRTGVFDENPYIFANGGLEDIAVANNDEIWFTVTDRNEVTRYEPSSDEFMPLTTRPPGSPNTFDKPVGITLDSTGTFWTTSFADSYIGRYGRGTLAFFRWTPTPTPDAGPAHIAFYNAGGRWFFFYTEYNSGRVSWLSALTNSAVAGTVTYPLSSPDAKPWGVDVDANGCAWFALTGIDAVAEWCAPYAQQIRLPIVGYSTQVQ